MDNYILLCQARQPIFIVAKSDLAKAIIPKLRQLVQQVIRGCVPCQKMNNLPFKYPEMEDLPDRRVQRARPFEHVGIDYFGPLTVKERDETVKAYGIIMTCTLTRLLHLELASDMTTANPLNALRWFLARRGVPTSITSNNGPYFLLGEQILQDAVLPVINDKSFAKAMATKGITWKTITPYAPWQGVFYERFIKSVKHSLYKVIQGRVLTKSEMETLLIEIEGSLNTRPLSYQEQHWNETPILRPIDFIQRDMVITFPFETCSTGNPVIPRNSWKIGIIRKLKQSPTVVVKQRFNYRTDASFADLSIFSCRLNWTTTKKLPTAKVLKTKRKQVLTPRDEVPEFTKETRYNLHPRKKLDYSNLHHGTANMQLVKTLPTTLLLLALLALFNASVEAVSTPLSSVRAFARRSSKRVELISFNAQKYELCAGEYCIAKEKLPKKETIQLPPEITLQDYFIQWEISDGHQVTVVEATSPQVPFCENGT
ncbi:hypothetical protein RB195_010883 [Necator americanus]|uniref:Integrase catalytic domain-containing protein n=1 Tax=Necator americanus TaxID=51031 RepID=A0ABR1CZX5_NECAM